MATIPRDTPMRLSAVPISEVYNTDKGRNIAQFQDPADTNEDNVRHRKLMYDAFGICSQEKEDELRAAAIEQNRNIFIEPQDIHSAFSTYLTDYLVETAVDENIPAGADRRHLIIPNPHNLEDRRLQVRIPVHLLSNVIASAVARYDALHANNTPPDENNIYRHDPVAVCLSFATRNVVLDDAFAFGIKRGLRGFDNGYNVENDNFLKTILIQKTAGDVFDEAEPDGVYTPDGEKDLCPAHPVYIRIALSGRGNYDDRVQRFFSDRIAQAKLAPLDRFDQLFSTENQGYLTLLFPNIVKWYGGEEKLIEGLPGVRVNTDPNAPPQVDPLPEKNPNEVYMPNRICTKFGSPSIFELWPSSHYSPIHHHGSTAGIVKSIYGKLNIVQYEYKNEGDRVEWDDHKNTFATGMIDSSVFQGPDNRYRGQCTWLNQHKFQIHKVASAWPRERNVGKPVVPSQRDDEFIQKPYSEPPKPAQSTLDFPPGKELPPDAGLLHVKEGHCGDFAASFHVYLNLDERQNFGNAFVREFIPLLHVNHAFRVALPVTDENAPFLGRDNFGYVPEFIKARENDERLREANGHLNPPPGLDGQGYIGTRNSVTYSDLSWHHFAAIVLDQMETYYEAEFLTIFGAHAQ